jgi:hypothetical protein
MTGMASNDIIFVENFMEICIKIDVLYINRIHLSTLSFLIKLLDIHSLIEYYSFFQVLSAVYFGR